MTYILYIFVFLSSNFLLCAGDLNGILTIFEKDGKTLLSDSSNGVIYLTGIETLPPQTPGIIEQINKSFAPRVLAIVKGQSVEFWNRDTIQHNVFCKHEMMSFDLARFPKDDFRAVKFEHSGFFTIYCNIHQQMMADILVLENRYFAITGSDGSYVIKDIPPGTYTLNAWHLFGGATKQEIVVNETPQTVPLTVISKLVLKQMIKHKNKDGNSYNRSRDRY